jgi:integrase/recombinase XerC
MARLEGWPRLALLLLYATGARLGEVGALRWEDVDLVAGPVHLHGKTGGRTVPLHPQVLAAIEAAPRRGIFVLGIEPITIHGLRYHLDSACYRAKVPRWTPHGLRRLACDTLYRAGVDVGTAAAVLGHSPQVALRYYRRASDADMREAVARARLGVLPAGDVISIEGRRL